MCPWVASCNIPKTLRPVYGYVQLLITDEESRKKMEELGGGERERLASVRVDCVTQNRSKHIVIVLSHRLQS